MDRPVDDMLKQAIGITDTDLGKLSSGLKLVLGSVGRCRLVAEVTESKYCLHGLKVGDKFVIDGGILNTRDSTAPFCMGALAPIDPLNLISMNRLASGLMPDGSVIGYAHCHDFGVDHGGLGEVYFRVHTEATG